MKEILIFAPILLPVVVGTILLILNQKISKKVCRILVGVTLLLVTLLLIFAIRAEGIFVNLFTLTEGLDIYFHIDRIGALFALLFSIIWLIAGIYSFEYMEKDEKEVKYNGFFLLVLGVIIGIDFAGNLFTFYTFYEFMTILSFPLVLHEGTKEAKMAGLKYAIYSFCGAYLALFGFIVLYKFAPSLTFTYGGVFDALPGEGKTLLLLSAIFMIVGFGIKAGLLPFHAWLSAAHPVAPSPASACLSGIIVKCGVLGIIRTVYYVFGTKNLEGTYVQNWMMILSLLTVLMGSALAYKEKVLKRRLAYSTISQVSYIVFGLSLFNDTALEGSILHVITHAFVKCGLFLVAGAIIHETGKKNVDELSGIGKEMPITMWCFTILSMSLIGIPPTGGFLSKWYLCTGALQTKYPVFSWLGPVVLLVSALLTAGYLLPISIKGFFPGKEYDYASKEKREPGILMIVSILISTAAGLIIGLI